MRQLAFIADDFGLTTEINEAILHAYREGALTGASLMLGQPASDHAVGLARANPGLDVGWHLHLCDSRPTTSERWPWGTSPVRAGLLLASLPRFRRLVRAEIRHQWCLYQQTGLPCRFLNSHHHLHLHPWVSREISRVIAGDAIAPGWFRGGEFRRFDRKGPGGWTGGVTGMAARLGRWAGRHDAISKSADSVWGVDRLFAMEAGEVAATAAALPEGLHEFIFHPRALCGDPDLEALLKLRAKMDDALSRDATPGR